MTPTRSTLLALALGTALGFALATTSGVLASRRPDAAELPWQDARLMAEVIDRVKAEYVDPVDDHELMQHAIRGMLSSLDPHSSFIHPEMATLLKEKPGIDPDVPSLGLTFALRDDGPYIAAVSPQGPAANAG